MVISQRPRELEPHWMYWDEHVRWFCGLLWMEERRGIERRR